MAGFEAINNFGSLTVNGKTIKFEDFDKDQNGEISTEEYNNLLNEIKLDAVELSTIDKNNDQILSTEEFANWEQKIQMQEAVNNMAKTISRDFTGRTQYLQEVQTELKNFIEEFAANYTGDEKDLVTAFKEALPEKYKEIKTNVLANDPTTIKSQVLDNIYTELTNPTDTRAALPNSAAKRIANDLEKEADNFIKNYQGNSLNADLKAHLERFINSSDKEILADAAADFKAGTEALGPFYDSNDLAVVKEYATDLLQAAVDKGVSINLGGVNIKTTAAIATALKKFDNAQELLDAINNALESLNGASRQEAIIKEEQAKAEEAANKLFAEAKGSEYAVDNSLIDYSKIDKRYFEEDGQIYERGRGWSGSREKAMKEGLEILNSDAMKSQIKAQIENMLKEKGIPFENVANIFENVYAQTAQDTLNADGMITGRGARGFSSRGKAYINVKNMCDTFVTNFNTNIAKAIDEMNASNTDMDMMDLDYNAMNTDKNGNPIKNGVDFAELYTSEKTINVRAKVGEKLVDNMKDQMLTKARTMCEANGVEFDDNVFETMFNNAKYTALEKGCEETSWFFKLFDRKELNVRVLMDTFTEQFKTNFSTWVEQEKAE